MEINQNKRKMITFVTTSGITFVIAFFILRNWREIERFFFP